MSNFMIPFVGFERGYFLDIQSFFPNKQLIGHKILTSTCNLRCYYCHRRVFLGREYQAASTERILASLQKLEFFNTIVLTGGEITPWCDAAIEIMKQLKSSGIVTLFSTNGSFPDNVERMLPFSEVVKIDVKGSRSQYEFVTGQEVYDAVLRSIAAASAKTNVEVKIILHDFTKSVDINGILEDVYECTGMPSNLAIEFQPIRDFLKLGISEPELEKTMEMCAQASPLPSLTLLKHYGEKERIYKLEDQEWGIFREKEIPLRFDWNDPHIEPKTI